MSYFSLLTLSLVLCSLYQAAGEVCYITTNSADLCTMQPCLTFSQFSSNSSHYLHSNTTLVFLPGIHYLSSVDLQLSDMDNFVMKSQNSTAAQIKCTNDLSMHFIRSRYIHITNLEFIGCGGNQISHVEEFVIKDAKFEGQKNSGTALELTETTMHIINCTFVSNRKGLYRKGALFDLYGCCKSGFAGGAIIATNSTVNVSQSKFKDNRADSGGAIFAENHSNIYMSDNLFISNSAASYSGGVLSSNNSVIRIQKSEFHNNGVFKFYDNSASFSLSVGGVLSFYHSTISIETSKFYNNTGANLGGVLSSYYSTVSINASEFRDNAATESGGVLFPISGNITIESSEFLANTAGYRGGVLFSENSINITMEASRFHDNSATIGGALHFGSINITTDKCEFHNNSAINWGGALYSYNNSNVTLGACTFTNNHSPTGAVIYGTDSSKIQFYNSLIFRNNWANGYAVIYLSDSDFTGDDSGNATFFWTNNLGSLMAFNCNITFTGHASFVDNQPSQNSSGDFQEGGAITLFQSNVFFDGVCNLEHNHAENGGAIHSTESKLYVNNNVTIAHNTATRNGGGVYLSTSELHCQRKSICELLNNSAILNGGGLHAISSPIKADSHRSTGIRLSFKENAGKRGGGLSLEANAKVYVLEYDVSNENTIKFTANHADYGGAVYVDDNTNSGTCASDPKTECFFQVLSIHGTNYYKGALSIYFSQNSANISGSNLFGGLLDRCAVSQFAQVRYKHYNPWQPGSSFEYGGNGEAYFYDSSNGESISISSLPVRVLHCIGNKQSYRYIEVKKGQTFTLPVVAVDHIGQPVSADIKNSLHFTESGLAEGQLSRRIPAQCTNLTFNVVSPHNTENLTLYASDGPCKDAELSRATVEIHFLPCSCKIGLQLSGKNSTSCTCDCHSDISQYMEHCDNHTGSLVKQSQSRAWISYINDTDLTGYLVYPNCPFDYCLSTSPRMDFNKPNGTDAQCAFDRSSLLCGSCRPGLSLSLGSSRCLPCPSYWPALFIAITIAAILAGIALVVLLLVLKMTVSVGTLNGLIFYANIVYAEKSILLPFQKTNFITVFISWLNLELGIDTCYFPGMNAYAKTWLQLAFPAYVIFLVVLVIIISSYSTKFSNLIGKKDPVATLATLILLSYAKFLEVCFKSLSVGILEYPDSSNAMLWLPDATVKYLSGKHIALFIAVVLILLVGLVYTALLFSWQWLLYLPRWRIFRWSTNPKIQTFIETYHKPYTPKHRYWTGLLLIVRIVLYLVSTLNASNDPTVAFTAITSSVCTIILLKGFIESKPYRKWSIDMLETFFYVNILLLVIFTWYSLAGSPDRNQKAVAYTSVILTFIVLLLIILYHVYTHTTVFSKAKKTKIGRKIDRLFTETQAKPNLRHCRWSPGPPPDNDIHRFDEMMEELDCPVYTDDYNVVPLLRQTPVEPTYSVVELPKLRDLAAPDPGEDASK